MQRQSACKIISVHLCVVHSTSSAQFSQCNATASSESSVDGAVPHSAQYDPHCICLHKDRKIGTMYMAIAK